MNTQKVINKCLGKNMKITIPCKYCKKTTEASETIINGKKITRCNECFKVFETEDMW